MSRRSSEAGFALPLAIFFMAILTLMLTAAFSKIQGDRRVADSSGAAVEALAVAQSGLQNYVASKTTRPADGDSTRVNVSGGYADVIAKIARKPVDTMAAEMFVVRSVGHVIDPTQGADPQATRTIAQFVQWQASGGLATYPGALTSTRGFNSWPAAGALTINGTDSAGCGGAAVPQLAIQTSHPSGSYTGVTAVGYSSSAWSTSLVGVDWDTIVSGLFDATYTSMTNLNSWSSYLITGNATLSTSGSGLLIVTDTLFITGTSVTWAGIIMVGDAIVFNATNTTISGLAMTGLEKINGGAPPRNDFPGTGKTLTVNYNTCNTRHALEFVTGFAPISNGWVDTWGTY